MPIVLDKGRPSPSQVEGRVLVPLRRAQIGALLAFSFDDMSDESDDDFALLDYAHRNPELP